MHSSFFVSAAGFSWLVLMLLLLMIHRHPSGGGMIVLASSTNDNQRGVVQSLLRGGEMSNRHLNTNNNNSGRSNTNNNSNGDTDDSGDGGDGSVKIRTTTSYRMFQLRATSMILNRVNTTISSAPSIEEDEGVGNDVYHDKDSSNNNASTNITQQQYPIQLRLPSCPPPYDPKNSNHRAGDTVEVYNTIFVCQPSPYDIYCNVDTLEEALLEQSQQQQLNEEEITMLWLHAWKEVGPCTPPSSSTSVPASTSSILPGTSSSMTTRIPSRRPTTTTTTSATTTQTTTPIPTTYYPTYHPTYSPTSTNDWPTYVPTSSPSWMPSSSMTPTKSPTLSPTRSPLAMSPTAYNNIMDENDDGSSFVCQSTQIHLRLEIVTDNYPQDTSWQFIDRTTNVILLSSPINGYVGDDIGNDGMMAVQTDIRDICLNGTSTITTNANSISPRVGATNTTRWKKNKYEFVIKDKYGDGLCCRPGVEEGYYKLLQKTKDILNRRRWKWSVVVAGSNFRSKEVHHHFDLLFHNVGTTTTTTTTESDIVQASLPSLDDGENDDDVESISKPTLSVEATSFELVCPPPQRKITIQIQTDVFGADTSWEFRMKNGPILAKNEARYRENHIELEERDICIHDSSLYELTVFDDYGDGMCCAYNRQGHYKILTHHPMSPTGLPNETILFGGFFKSDRVTHLINTTLPILSDRDMDWLNSHNKRRLYWHTYYNTSYVPLQWSDSLKADAQVWADTLLDSCKEGMYHDPQKIYGENAAANSGAGSWGTKRDADLIVARFIDREVDDPWPANGHLTQALWRASNYVGCADSHIHLGGEKHCHTQVCRYARIGNCDMGSHLNEDGTIDWKTPMLEDVNYCGPICPADGCKA